MKIIKEDILVLLSIGSFVLANVDQYNIGHSKDDRESGGFK